MVHRLEREQVVQRPLEEVFGFFALAGNLEALTPPWLSFRIVTPQPIEMRVGAVIEYRLRLHGLPISWYTRIEEWEPGRSFVDRQLYGPYALWHHRHTFEAVDGSATRMRDTVDYALPLGPLGEVAHRLLVSRDLRRIFDFRRQAVEELITESAGSARAPRA